MPNPQLSAPLLSSEPGHAKLAFSILQHLRNVADGDRADISQFLAFAIPLAGRSHSQLFQELWALWMSGGKRGGYFVEFGGGDGVNLSNTYFLETEMDWTGIVAEPHPRQVEQVRAARRCHVSDRCVYSRSGETLAFRMARKGEYSRLEDIAPDDGYEERKRSQFELAQVETITLDDLLLAYDAPRTIDYISVDTEGSEVEILRAFDFGRWDVRTFSVEHNKTAAKKQLDTLFHANGYRRMWPDASQFDAWYVKAD